MPAAVLPGHALFALPDRSGQMQAVPPPRVDAVRRRLAVVSHGPAPSDSSPNACVAHVKATIWTNQTQNTTIAQKKQFTMRSGEAAKIESPVSSLLVIHQPRAWTLARHPGVAPAARYIRCTRQ